MGQVMAFILDIAAGVLIAAAIVGIVVAGVRWSNADARLAPGGGTGGLLLALFGVLIWIAFVVCRLLRWP